MDGFWSSNMASYEMPEQNLGFELVKSSRYLENVGGISKLDSWTRLLGMGCVGLGPSRVSPNRFEDSEDSRASHGTQHPETRDQWFFFQFLNFGPTWAVEEVKG